MTLNMTRFFSLLSVTLIFIYVIYALIIPDQQTYPGIVLFGIYFIVGFIRQNSPLHQFIRFCIGESAAIGLWFVSPVPGVMTALLVTAEFLYVSDVLKIRNGYSLLALWGPGICLLAFLSEKIQHTLIPCVAVLFLAGFVALSLLLFEYRIVYRAGGSGP